MKIEWAISFRSCDLKNQDFLRGKIVSEKCGSILFIYNNKGIEKSDLNLFYKMKVSKQR